MAETCPFPDCGAPLYGLARYCSSCGQYVDDYRPDGDVPTPPKEVVPDDRDEKEIQTGIMRAVELVGYHAWNLAQPRNTMQSPGLADLFVTGHGLNAWLEVKRPRERQRKSQLAFEEAVTENGGHYRVVRSETEAVEYLEGLRKRAAA